MLFAEHENELLTLVLEKLYRLRKRWIIETDPAQKLKLHEDIVETEHDLDEITNKIDHVEQQYLHTHKNIIRDIEYLLQ